MEQRHAQNKLKVDECFAQLQAMGMVPKSKMWQFYRNVSKTWCQLDSEFVNCRRQKRIGLTYTELETKLYECIAVFEQWALMAALMY